MKRQFYLDEVERGLLRCAVMFWSERIADGMNVPKAHVKCGEFVQRRIAEILMRLQEPEPPKP